MEVSAAVRHIYIYIYIYIYMSLGFKRLNLVYHIVARTLLITFIYFFTYLFWFSGECLCPLCIEHWWNNTDKEKLLAVPVCPPQIQHGLTR